MVSTERRLHADIVGLVNDYAEQTEEGYFLNINEVEKTLMSQLLAFRWDMDGRPLDALFSDKFLDVIVDKTYCCLKEFSDDTHEESNDSERNKELFNSMYSNLFYYYKKDIQERIDAECGERNGDKFNDK